ncbi:hypothetical protein KHU50_004498 [Colletotrichum sp. SAR 10_65]|nr:hypothetical protein KHU50_004498 [Colletotrichum sp. SAR 10_65]KAI8178662.1 hypothetical protein K4K51_004360 [Colletotrichum sp. SAR 10_75]
MSQTKDTASQSSPAGTPGQQGTPVSTPRPRGPPLHKIYELPAPIRTFPLPSFYPSNPISFFHVLYAWTKQTFFPPPAEPSVVYEGIWSPESKSVNVFDAKSMRALWEQGFYGKGNLSRSEPNWLKREQVRRGLVPGQVSELVTANRREERRQMKWERAKSEQEAIRQTRLQEAQEATSKTTDATVSSVNGHEPALTDAISLPEPIVPADPATEQESLSQDVTKDASINTPTELKPGVVPSASLDSLSAVETGLVNGVSSPIEPLTANLGSATIIEPEDALRATEIAKALGEPLSPLLTASSSPTGPLELLRLPNSHASLAAADYVHASTNGIHSPESTLVNSDSEDVTLNGVNGSGVSVNGPSSPVSIFAAPVGPLELLSLPNAHVPVIHESNDTTNGISKAKVIAPKLSTIPEDVKHDGSTKPSTGHLINDLLDHDRIVNGTDTESAKALSTTSTDIPSTPTKPMKRRKSVRFSPKVESATYLSSDPPSPSFALLNGKSIPSLNGASLGPSVVESDQEPQTNGTHVTQAEATPTEIVNKEHLQLTSEEAFFLTFGLGALRVVNPINKQPIPTPELLNLFRQYSYFPSRASTDLHPDDSFLVNYAVYHHFRSLGWVPRAGIKFGVDWMLYAKGPVFDHAEFGAIILPSYSDQWWKDSDRELPRKTWHWLHGVVRVLSHVQKSLVLVYVDIPPPPQFDEALQKGGPAEIFKLYKIREVMVKRWSSNRNR